MRSIQGTCNCNSRMSHLKKKTNQLEEKICSNNMSLHLDPHPKKRKVQEKKNRERIQEDLSGLDHKHNFAISRNQLDIRQFLFVKRVLIFLEKNKIGGNAINTEYKI